MARERQPAVGSDRVVFQARAKEVRTREVRKCFITRPSTLCSREIALTGRLQFRAIMRRAVLFSVIGVFGIAVVLALAHDPLPAPMPARLQSAFVKGYTRISPGPIKRLRWIMLRVEVPPKIADLVAEHVAYGEMRSLPDGPMFHLSAGGVVEESETRVCQWVLDPDASDASTEQMREVLQSDYRFEIRLRVWDQRRVLAESDWIDATSLLRPLAEDL